MCVCVCVCAIDLRAMHLLHVHCWNILLFLCEGMLTITDFIHILRHHYKSPIVSIPVCLSV